MNEKTVEVALKVNCNGHCYQPNDHPWNDPEKNFQKIRDQRLWAELEARRAGEITIRNPQIIQQ